MRGDPGISRPMQGVPKTNPDENVVHFPLSSVFNPADSLCYPTPQQQAVTPTRKTARNKDNASPGASHH